MTSAGSFATARRGGVLQSEVNEARHKLGARATPAQIAKVLGRCEADVRAILCGGDVEGMPRAREPWPLGGCDGPHQSVIREVCAAHGVQVADLKACAATKIRYPSPAARALIASIKAVREAFPDLTLIDQQAIFQRDKASLCRWIGRHRGEAA